MQFFVWRHAWQVKLFSDWHNWWPTIVDLLCVYVCMCVCLQHQHKPWQFVWWCRYLLDVLHEQERIKALSETASIGSGGQINAMETAEIGGMSRWTTEEDLSSQNIEQFKASSLADFTHCERTGISFHLFGLCCLFERMSLFSCINWWRQAQILLQFISIH